MDSEDTFVAEKFVFCAATRQKILLDEQIKALDFQSSFYFQVNFLCPSESFLTLENELNF